MDFIHRLVSQDKKKKNKNYGQKTEINKSSPMFYCLLYVLGVCVCVFYTA
jgi:hypothetical protein